MITGATACQHHTSDPSKTLDNTLQLLQIQGGRFQVYAPPQYIRQRLGLLHDLLEHEMLKLAFCGRHWVLRNVNRVSGHTITGYRPNLDCTRLQRRHLAASQEYRLVRERDERWQVAGDKSLLIADTNHEPPRVPVPRSYHCVRKCLARDEHSQSAPCLSQHPVDGRPKIEAIRERLLNEMWQDLGICLRSKRMTARRQL